jgi:hypothetical protein
MRFRIIYALGAALTACVMLFGAVALAAPGNGNGTDNANANANANAGTTTAETGGGSNSTATSGPGNSGQGCDGTHNSDTGHGANQGGPYDNTCDGSPSGNGNGNGQATGKPCAGCVGNADDKNPKGQMPNGSDHNAGYECDRNHGIGRTNPAHTGCQATTENPPPQTCPNGQPVPPNGKCETENPPPKTCPNGQPLPANGNCGGGNNPETPPPTTPSGNTPQTPQQVVLGERVSSPEATTAPNNQAVLGEETPGSSPSTTNAPSTAQETRTATPGKELPFTGTDGIAVLLAGALLLLAGVGLRRLAAHRV